MRQSIIISVLTVWLAAGCTESGVGRRPPPRTNIVTGSTGSTWYTMGSGLAEKANAFFDGHPITAVPGAGGVSNPVRVSMTGVDLGISYGPFLSAAYQGDSPFRKPYPELRLVAALISNRLHVFAKPELDLHTVGDLKTLDQSVRIGTGIPGSGELFCLTALLTVMGTDLDKWQEQGSVLRLSATAQRFDDWKDERLEVAMTFVNDPSPQLMELMTTRPGEFLPVPPELRIALREQWGFREATVEPGTYPNQNYAIETVALPSILFTVADVDEMLVYAMTRALYENQDYMTNIHPGFAQWDPMDLPDDVGVPYHPGAVKYYRERGFMNVKEPALEHASKDF